MLVTNLCMFILCFDVGSFRLIMKCTCLGLSSGMVLEDPIIRPVILIVT